MYYDRTSHKNLISNKNYYTANYYTVKKKQKKTCTYPLKISKSCHTYTQHSSDSKSLVPKRTFFSISEDSTADDRLPVHVVVVMRVVAMVMGMVVPVWGVMVVPVVMVVNEMLSLMVDNVGLVPQVGGGPVVPVPGLMPGLSSQLSLHWSLHTWEVAGWYLF